MKENRKLLKEVLKEIRHDMTDEEVLNLLADSQISVKPESGKDKYTLRRRNRYHREICRQQAFIFFYRCACSMDGYQCHAGIQLI